MDQNFSDVGRDGILHPKRQVLNKPKAMNNSFVTNNSLPTMLFQQAAFDNEYPYIPKQTRETEKGQQKNNESKVYIMFMNSYLNAAKNAKKFLCEDCQHSNVEVRVDQKRCIDEMGSLTRFCKDCGHVSMKC